MKRYATVAIAFLYATITTSAQVYPEEEMWSYEAGLKSMWLENRLKLNVAAFYIDWSNQRFQRTVVGVSNDGRLVSGMAFVVAGKSEVYGIEGPAWSLLAATERHTGEPLADSPLFESALTAARMAEPYPELLSASSHLLVVGRRPV